MTMEGLYELGHRTVVFTNLSSLFYYPTETISLPVDYSQTIHKSIV